MQTSNKRMVRKGDGRGGRVLLRSVIVSLWILLSAVTGIALLVSGNKIGLAQCSLIISVFYAVAVFVGCFLTARKTEGIKLLWSAAAAISTFGIVLGTWFAMPYTEGGAIGKMLWITVGAWIGSTLLGARKRKRVYR